MQIYNYYLIIHSVYYLIFHSVVRHFVLLSEKLIGI